MARGLRVLAVVGLIGVAGTGVLGCGATPTPGIPAVCYDSTGGFSDFRYSGVANVMGNMDSWSSTDGSCTDPAGVDIGGSTLVLAADERVASRVCRWVGSGDALGRWVDFGYGALPRDAWLCGTEFSRSLTG
jgi:hypothetical protein